MEAAEPFEIITNLKSENPAELTDKFYGSDKGQKTYLRKFYRVLLRPEAFKLVKKWWNL